MRDFAAVPFAQSMHYLEGGHNNFFGLAKMANLGATESASLISEWF